MRAQAAFRHDLAGGEGGGVDFGSVECKAEALQQVDDGPAWRTGGVGEEAQRQAAGTQPGERRNRAGDRLVANVQHAGEVDQDGLGFVRQVHVRLRLLFRIPPGGAKCAEALPYSADL